MLIDYERLEIIVTGDIAPDLRERYDIPTIVQNATIKDNAILVQGPDFWFRYDKITYEQINGGGGVPDE